MDITTAQQAAEAAIAAQDLSSGMGGHGSAYRAAHECQRYARLTEELAGPQDAEWVFLAQAAEGRCTLARAYYDGPEMDLARPWPAINPGIRVAVTILQDQLAAITVGQYVWTVRVDEKGTGLEDRRRELVERVTDARITTSWGNPDTSSYVMSRYRVQDGVAVGQSKSKRPRTITSVDA